MPLAQFMLDHFEEDKREKLFNKIKTLEKKLKRDLFTNIRKNSDKINFYSWLTEMRFGLYFNEFCNDLKYEQALDGQKVDWTLTLNGQKILSEVRRINNMAEDELRIYIKRVLEINRLNRENGKTIYSLGSSAVCLNSQYFYGSQSKVTEKETIYRDLITKHNIPFIISIAPISETYIDALDCFDFLIGNTKKGLFYTDLNFGKHVTGVLMRTYYGDFFYFSNELAKNPLNEENFKLFDACSYKQR